MSKLEDLKLAADNANKELDKANDAWDKADDERDLAEEACYKADASYRAESKRLNKESHSNEKPMQ